MIQKKKRYFWDLIFAIGVITTTMTSLRIPGVPLGIGEILLAFWIIREWIPLIVTGNIKIRREKKNILMFWVLFFIILSVGMIFSSFKGRLLFKNAIYDLSAYLFSFILCLTLSIENKEESLYMKLKLIVVLGTLMFGFLLMWWKFIGPNFMGINIVYGGVRFAGGAINPNQLALFLVPVPGFALYFLNNKCGVNKLTRNMFFLFIFFTSIYIGISTGSDSLNATLLLTSVFFISVKIYRKFKFPYNIMCILLILIIILLIILLNAGIIDNMYTKGNKWFDELDKDRSRAYLWIKGIKTAFESPIVGFGPGAQILIYEANRVEVHNTFIDVLTQAGFLGLLSYLFLLLIILKRIDDNIYLMCSFGSLLIFSIAHFTLRQPIFWIYLSLINIVHGRRTL